MADNDLRIIIQAQIDQSTMAVRDLNTQISQLSQKLNKLAVAVTIDKDKLQFLSKEIENQFANTASNVSRITKGQLNNAFKGEMYVEVRKQLNTVLDDVERKNGNIRDILINQDTKTGAITSATIKYSDALGKVLTDLYKIKTEYINIEDKNGNLQKRLKADLIQVSSSAQNNVLQQQTANFREAEKQLGLIQGLKTKLLLEADQESNLAKELNVQIQNHEKILNQVLSRKIEISNTEKVSALNQQQSNSLERLRLDLIEKQNLAMAKRNDKSTTVGSSASLGQRNIGTNVGVSLPVGSSPEEMTRYVQALSGAEAELTRMTPKVDSVHGKIQELHYRVQEGGKYWHNYVATMVEATGQTHLLDKGLTDVTNRQLGFNEQMKIALTRFPVWMAASTLFFQSLHFITDGIKYVNELNATLTQISTAVNYNQEKVAQLGATYQQLAVTMGVTTAEISKGALEFFRQGLNDDQVLNRLKTTTEYAKISGLEFTQSADLLTAASNSMNVDVTKVADTFTLLGRQNCPVAA